jgi:hypothetical protein
MYKILINHSFIDIAEEYSVNYYFTIKELKDLILKKHNYSNIKLIFSGKVLKDDYTLEYYDICEENMIICMGNLKMNNPPRRANNPNSTPSNFPQINRPNISTNDNITLNNSIQPFLNLPSLSSIPNSGSVTNRNNFIGLITTTFNRNNVLSSLTQNISNTTSTFTNMSEFMNIFSQLGSITNIRSSNPFSNTNQMPNYDLNRPINENDNSAYAYGIQELRNLGFYNNIHNINALKYTNNNINEAINILVNYA